MDSGSEKTFGVTTEAPRPGATRVRFRERQVLRAADLNAEQSYLIAVRRRHNIGHHGWGIVKGLEVSDTPELMVQPGIAVDGHGRELIVSSPLAIPPKAFSELKSDAIDIWLFYEVVAVDVPQRGSWDCGPGSNTRIREQSSLRITAARNSDPRLPAEVPAEDLPFPPYKTPPDDPAREWPVYLGTVHRTATSAPTYDPKTPRPYATLTGEVVNSPSARARMQVGSELETDTRRFAVSVADSAGKPIERLAVDRDGNTVITGNTTVLTRTGEQTSTQLLLRENKAPDTSRPTRSTEPLCGAPTGTGAGTVITPGAARMINLLPLAATPAVAAPWQIYRTSINQSNRAIEQLRIEIGHPGDEGDPKLSRLTVGTRDTAGHFNACFTLMADSTITVEGALNVVGELIKGAVHADAADPRFSAEIASQWAAGTIIAEVQLGTAFSGINSGGLRVGIASLQAQRGSATPRTVENVIAPDESLLYAFIVNNDSDSRITDIQLYVNLVFNRNTTEEKLPVLPFDLEPHRELLIAGTRFDPAGQEGLIEMSVVAVGVGPLPNVMGAADSAIVGVRNLGGQTDTITGTVRDTNGAVIPGASVEIKNVVTNAMRTVSTDVAGRFSAVNLPPGRYTVTVSLPGFVTQVLANVDLTVAPTLNLNFSLVADP